LKEEKAKKEEKKKKSGDIRKIKERETLRKVL